MLSVLSKNKSYTSISIEKGVLETHGIKSWIWDSDGCLLYGEQGAIRCRLAVRAENLDEATEIINSDYTQIPDTDQSEELPASKTQTTPYFGLICFLGLLLTLIISLILPWLGKIMGIGESEASILLIKNLGIVILASLPISWGLHLVDFHKTGKGVLKTFGTNFVQVITLLAALSILIKYSNGSSIFW